MFVINILNSIPKTILLVLVIISLLLLCYIMTKKTSSKVFLIDFACYKPPNSQKSSKEHIRKYVGYNGRLSEDTMDFMKRAFKTSNIGDSTYLPEIYFRQTYSPSMKDARTEVEMAIFGSIDTVLAKTGVRCEDIGILVVNCCVYNTVPSLSSIVVNRYKFKESIKTYNLTGMGCSAGLLAIGLAKQLLQVHDNSYALIVSTESLTENCYLGEDRSKILINMAFRLGGAAILLSNSPSSHKNSKYELLHAIHTNNSSSDRSYNSIFREEDTMGILGITVTRNLLEAAIATIQPNLATLGYLLLPRKEKVISLINYYSKKHCPGLNIPPYKPDYRNAVDHFLPHVGGKAVLDSLQKNLDFSEETMEASRMTLYRYGNTSSSSIWYELAYVEAKGRVKKGNRVLQLAFGSGFKCTGIIWSALKTVDRDDNNPWTDEIDDFPVTFTDHEPTPFYFGPSE